eukprot:CAMPEP_0206016382 /NCGR_PEP_ID=MMETSP1464-20131121/22667_1 /ASSEMBLY_ACC=CAM_ASM_001124 /TAXON_ID=119497 /ORGANISM="Exanthemachrysis gayraliae, Strain RCC1523" /LENGTH=93 /DNA_ID=CAMNT_0053390197 /DNA_START=35 /DNA_END=313 /DNA_ORIENTATION=-
MVIAQLALATFDIQPTPAARPAARKCASSNADGSAPCLGPGAHSRMARQGREPSSASGGGDRPSDQAKVQEHRVHVPPHIRLVSRLVPGGAGP